jgi:hypothetical protein
MKRAVLLLLATFLLPCYVFADGHGPVFGLATPTNSKGEWSFDSGVFGRANSFDSQASFRELIAYGFTPHVTLSFTAPVVFGNASLTPTRIQPGSLRQREQPRKDPAVDFSRNLHDRLFRRICARPDTYKIG